MHYDPNRLKKQAEAALIAHAKPPSKTKCSCGRTVNFTQTPAGPNPIGKCHCGRVVYFSLKDHKVHFMIME